MSAPSPSRMLRTTSGYACMESQLVGASVISPYDTMHSSASLLDIPVISPSVSTRATGLYLSHGCEVDRYGAIEQGPTRVESPMLASGVGSVTFLWTLYDDLALQDLCPLWLKDKAEQGHGCLLFPSSAST
ncbi:uncharacterized protein DS421_18g619380 [Arachis hypogaea]|nr:uncharacterized protein DS421_18g619380 [Arachis hypogaea]